MLSAAGALLALACAPATSAAAQVVRDAGGCAEPAASWQTREPQSLGLDPRKLQELLDFARGRNSQSIAVYRHGCLAGINRAGSPDRRFQSYSVGKSVVSMAAGRAITLRLLSLEDRVGSLVTEADRDHGRLTVRQLLTMSTGLHWNFYRDYNVFMPRDRVADTLTLPFDHEPGIFFEYAQSPVALLAEVVGRAARRDFADFVQDELFAPVGIAPGSWNWERDAKGRIQGFYGLHMRDVDYARLGELMRRDGAWRGRRLISSRYVGQATSPSPTNGGYGFMFWVNAGKTHVTSTVDYRDTRDRRLIESGPPDLWAMFGLLEQRVTVVPSLGLMLVRLGTTGSQPAETDVAAYAMTSPAGELDHELVRRLMAAVADVKVRDAGPYEAKGPTTPFNPSYGLHQSALEREHMEAARQAPPLPPAGPPRARAAQILSSSARMRRGRLTVRVACPPAATQPCAGPLRVDDRRGRNISAGAFFAAPGASDRVRMGIRRAFRRRLARRRARPIAARLRTFSRDSLGGTQSSERLRVLPRRPRSRRPFAGR